MRALDQRGKGMLGAVSARHKRLAGIVLSALLYEKEDVYKRQAWNGSPYLLSRSILYTAIPRARELLIIVGREETVAAMVENAKKNRRYTGLKLRLQGKTE